MAYDMLVVFFIYLYDSFDSVAPNVKYLFIIALFRRLF